MKTFIGTCPFKFAEHQPGRSVKLVRFEQYQARPEPPNGYGGGKTAWVDTLLFIFASDTSAGVAAVESGEGDAACAGASPEFSDPPKDHPDLKVQIVKPFSAPASVLNKKKGLFTNIKLRQAFLAALDMEAILRAAYGHPEFYRLEASLSFKEEPWWTDVGRELYNHKDKEKAKRLLREAGYHGEPMRYMAEPGVSYRLALATKQQLEEAGFNVELQEMKLATRVQRRDDPSLWDAYTINFSDRPDPTLHPAIRCDSPWSGWNRDPDFEKLLHTMATELQFEKRYRL